MIPRWLHRFGYRGAHQLRKIYCRLERPTLQGCSVVARDERGFVLLVRHTYGEGLWQLPGGGVGKGETTEQAALREFKEETGLTLTDTRSLGSSIQDFHGAYNHVHLFAGRADGDARSDGREIADARWFAPDALPRDRGEAVTERISASVPGYSPGQSNESC